QANYGVGIAPSSIAVGDFNGDGKLDLAVGSPISGVSLNAQSEISILLNTGSGGFSAGSSLGIGPLESVPTSIVASDFNNDGRLDLAVALNNTNAVVICEGNGDGTFAIESTPLVGNDPVWLAAADFNGDGKIDLIVNNNADGTLSVLFGNGDETFGSATTYPTGTHPTSLALADLNGDGEPDVAIVNNGDSNVQAMLGRGDGMFFVGFFPVGANPGGIATGDFNGDGIPDLAVTKGDATVGIFLGDGRGGFTALPPFIACQSVAGGLPGKIAAADVNGDNKLDLAIGCASTSPGSSFVNLFQGNGDGTFVNPFGWGVGDPPFRIIAVDVHGAGISEFVIANDLGVAAVNLDSTFFDNIIRNISFQGVAAGDFNGDGKTDLLAIGSGTNPGIILLGDGAGNFQQGSPLGWPGGLTGDFNGDGLTDFLNYQGIVQVVLNQGNANFLLGSDFQGNPGRPQALADFDGDGVLDVLTAFGGAPLNVFLGHQDGIFDQQPAVSLSQLGTATVAVADFDGNGSPDVAALDFSTGTVSILLNKNSFQPTSTILSQSATKVVVGQSFTLSAAVNSKQGTPTGNVSFKQAGVPQTTAVLAAGMAQTNVTAPTATGQYGYTALYGGDGTFSGSYSQRLLVNVSAASSTTVVSSSQKTSRLGQSVTLTASVTPQYSGVPTGSVDFFADGQPIGSGAMNNGQASISISTLTQGSHTIEADYSGDADFTASLGLFTQKVGKASSTVTLTSSLNPATYGQAATVTATITDSDGTVPTGTVVFSESGAIYGSITLNAGVAQLTLPQLLVGTHVITAQYSGDSSDSPSKANLTETIQGAPSTTVIGSSLNPSNYGQAIIFSATVTSVAGIPDGTVTFKNGTQALGTVTVSGGQAQLSVSTINAGARTIAAIYNGGTTTASSQNTLQQIVVAAPTTVALAGSPNPASLGQAVTLTATVNCASASPVGTVTFKDGKTAIGTATVINGQAQFTTSVLTTGTHGLTAIFKGSQNFAGSASSTMQEVIN
ncbi:MAG TPA: Ig-like domain repeat protein, partial [Terriglobales bacterium]